MVAGTFPDAWLETCLIGIKQAGGSERQFAAITSDVKIDEPDYPGESVANTAGGRLWMQKPQEDGEVTLTMHPIGAEEADNTSAIQYFHGGTVDSSQPILTNKSFTAGISKQRETYMVAVLWTDDTAMTTAGATSSTSAKTAIRWYCKLARIISHKSTFSPEDGLKVEVTFKFPPMNKAGTTRTFGWASTNDGSTALGALTYTGPTDL